MSFLTSEILPGPQLHGEAKVGELDVTVVVQEDVLRLQVPVDDVQGVEVLDGFQQSLHHAPGRHRGTMEQDRQTKDSFSPRKNISGQM